ncbi:CbtA family protein [Micromonospora sp. NBC_01813]|uniref:CbtA family protein n=1 Tax=Micromonospora sp. NBC_01813 TaxID=2975988 RepID=UPI002DDC40AB|nr:CbtA family protein [Micromonospora sp. NBC_01813]WSA10669.1 CbtA family protein [Micromonospora sp. NBC_01813]
MRTLSFGAVLRRGLLAGLAAGVAGSMAALLIVEPQIESALVVEESRTAGEAAGHSHDGELVSRAMQVFGGLVATVAVALCLALIVAVVFAATRHLLPGRDDFRRVGLLAGLGFVVVALLPAIRFPANPPGVGDPGTVNQRTGQYLSFIIAAAALTWLALLVHRRLAGSRPEPLRAVVATAVAIVGYALLLALWPATAVEVPADIPAVLLWEFRLASLAQLATMWTVLGVVFGLLLTPATVADRRPALADAA